MTRLSQLSETLIGSEIVKLGNQISELIRSGHQIYNCTIGDFDSSVFRIPEELKEYIKEAYDQGYTTYPPGEGNLEFRQAIGDFLRVYQGLDYSVKEIQVASGGRPLIYAIFRAIVDKGDKVIYPVPSWNNNHYTHFNEGIHIQITTTPENKFMPTAEEIAPHLSGATLIALCSPLNPTGTTISKTELTKICDLILEENSKREEHEKKLYLLYDQIYWTLKQPGVVHYDPVSLRPEMKGYTIFVDGISKSLASTGLRVGWSMGPEIVISKVKAILSHIGAWAPMAEQVATTRFLNNKVAFERYMKGINSLAEERLQGLYQGFIRMKNSGLPVDAIAPEAAIYLTVKIDIVGKKTTTNKTIETQYEAWQYILREAKLALVPFSSFGASKESPWWRLSIGTMKSEDIPAIIQNLELALDRLSD
jgi:aspartate aminotransferase